MKKSLFPTLLLILAFTLSAFSAENKPKANIIYKHTGFGLARDAEILTKELKDIGYSVRPYKVNSSPFVRQADINIFLEEINEDFLPSAKKNYFIPNPEWFSEDVSILQKFDVILCKTRVAERTFREFHSNTIFMGFTSLDRYNPKIKKDFRKLIHLAGKSPKKGTDNLVKAWELNPDLPGLIIYRHQGRRDYPPLNNMRLFCCFVPDKDLIKKQNKYGIHLCPSETEGFGQYLMEALSCGVITITTNAPPMNEFVMDQRCLVNYTHTDEQWLGTNFYVDPVHLGQVVSKLMLLSDNELAEIGKKNREFYLKSKLQFEEKMREIFKINRDGDPRPEIKS